MALKPFGGSSGNLKPFGGAVLKPKAKTTPAKSPVSPIFGNLSQKPKSTPYPARVPAKAPAAPKAAAPKKGVVTGKTFGPPQPPSPTWGVKPKTPSAGSGGVGSSDTGAVAAFAAAPAAEEAPAAPVVPQMTEAEFLAQDAEFNDVRAGATRDYENLLAQLGTRRTEQELNSNNTLRNLGWRGDKGWDQQDKLSGYGQAYQNQLGDFASRGMLDSSLYGGALNDLNRGFEQQRGDIGSQLAQFIAAQEQDKTQAAATKESTITTAQRQAIARMAAGIRV